LNYLSHLIRNLFIIRTIKSRLTNLQFFSDTDHIETEFSISQQNGFAHLGQEEESSWHQQVAGDDEEEEKFGDGDVEDDGEIYLSVESENQQQVKKTCDLNSPI